MRRYLGALLLSAMLIAPVVIRADDRHDKRYYDRDRRDYHEWNEREEQAYRRWLQERRHEYRDWGRTSRKEQREYFRWRHEHPDNDRH
ncbi:MAG TPA: hypothetical protein VGZ73_06885 [Bryobacteraceae bacterium]|jgi:hypothetical protein|nr:hypothetical protein [Bryobacteraceae bacterium]